MTDSRPHVETLGCRLNEYESEAMSELATEEGLSDAVIVNTCAVTAEATRKSRQAVRRVARQNPNAKLVVTGCAAQIAPESFSSIDGVDAIIGNGRKLSRSSWRRLARDNAGRQGPHLLTGDIMPVKRASNRLISSFGSRARAHIQVQNGCDHRCTFCIIPQGRGNSRSVAASEAVAQVRKLVGNGYREVVLSGVDLTCWGQDLPGKPELGGLVSRILGEVPDLDRLRLSSVDVVEIDDRLKELIGCESRLMPHLHLSLQAGHNLILKRMKRRHLREDAVSFCSEMRKARPDIAYGADLIAGFPTETEEMFASTLELIRECGITWLHVFPYSSRGGTPAARMPQVEYAAIKHRSSLLRKLAEQRVQEHLAGWVGRKGPVLMETSGTGRTEQFAEVAFEEDLEVGSIVAAEFVGTKGRHLTGRLAAQDS